MLFRFDAARKDFHDAFVGRLRPMGNPPCKEDDFAMGTMGADLLHESCHSVREFWRFGLPPTELPGIHDDIVPNLL